MRVPNGGLQPQVIVDRQHVLHLVYFKGEALRGDVYYVYSSDAGRTFSEPIRVNSQRGSAVAAGTIRGAQLAVGSNGRVHVAWNGSTMAWPKAPLNPQLPKNSPHNGLPMLYSRLNDAGDAFEPQRNLMQDTFGLDGGGSLAADDQGNVYVAWHGKVQGAPEGEAGRQVFLAHSEDAGKTFTREKPAFDEPTGACACCGMRLFVDHKGNLYSLYRSAKENVHRDIHLLLSNDHGKTFQGKRVHEWKINACPVSSMSFTQGVEGAIAAWETRGQVYWSAVSASPFEISEPVPAPGPGDQRKHPVVVTNSGGQILLLWMRSKGWKKPGDLEWQLFDQHGQPLGKTGHVANLPLWSFGSAFTRQDGSFVLLF